MSYNIKNGKGEDMDTLGFNEAQTEDIDAIYTFSSETKALSGCIRDSGLM